MPRLILTGADSDKRIQAIKDVRAASGLGLREAKEAVDKVCFKDGSWVRSSGVEVTILEDSERHVTGAAEVLREGGHTDYVVSVDRSERHRAQSAEAAVAALIAVRDRSDTWTGSRAVDASEILLRIGTAIGGDEGRVLVDGSRLIDNVADAYINRDTPGED